MLCKNFYSEANVIKLGLHLLFHTTWQEMSIETSTSFPQMKNLLNYAFQAPRSKRQLKALVFTDLADNMLNSWRSFALFPNFPFINEVKKKIKILNILDIKYVKRNTNHGFK